MTKNKNNNKKNVIITGESGLLGSTLRLELDKCYNIIPFNCDITDFNAAKFDRYKNKIYYIIHTAAIASVKKCEDNNKLCNAVNIKGTKNVVNLAKRLNSELIFISTASVFSGEKGDYRESDIPRPKSYYDISKYKGEQIVNKYKKGVVIRLNLIGIHPNGSRGLSLLEWLYNNIKANNDIILYNDVIVNPLSNWSVAAILKKIMKKNIRLKILHIGSGNCLSKADIGKIAIDKIGDYKGKAKISSIGKHSKVMRPKKMWLNIKLAEKKLNMKMPKLESEINKIFIKLKKPNEQYNNK